MGKQIINVGTSANDGTGDKNRVAFQKCNSNFDELYDGQDPINLISTDPDNAIELGTDGKLFSLESIPLSGTEVDKPITGDLKYGMLDGETRKITFKSPDEFDFDLRFGDDGSQLGAQPIIMGFYSTDGTSYGKFGLDSSFNPVIEIGNGTNFGYLQFVGNQTLRFYSDNPLCSGIDGFVDYSGNYISTSFVQKGYVDGLRGKHISKTTTEINAISSPQDGETYFNTTLGTLCFYDGSTWQKVSFTTM